MNPRTRSAFTLVELLVVIAIIGILVALLLPAVQAAREAARRSSCSNNLAQLIIAVTNYEMAHGIYPPGTLNPTGPIQNKPVGYHHSWLVQILPYIEETNAFRNVDFSVGVYHRKNRPVRRLSIRLLQCPSASNTWRGPGFSFSSYAAVHHDVEAPIDVDNHGVFFLNSTIRYEDISDGASHTLFLGEKIVDNQDLGWMSGTRATLRNTGVPPNATGFLPGGGGPNVYSVQPGLIDDESLEMESGVVADEPEGDSAEGAPAEGDEPEGDLQQSDDAAGSDGQAKAALNAVGGFGSFHPGGAMFAFGDGRISFLSSSINAQIYQQLGHRNDGKLLSSDEY
jgi:prepilin-type N-terminal cleavage/methylation domain-containing protein